MWRTRTVVLLRALLMARWAMLGFILLSIKPVLAKSRASYSVLAKLTSNYVYQGFSKSSGNPVVQGNIDVEYASGLFVGTWISQIDLDDSTVDNRADIEVNPYIGWSRSFSDDWSFDASLSGYIYNGKLFDREADYGALSSQIHFRDLITAGIDVSYDAYGSNTSVQDYSLQGRFPLANTVDISGNVGYSDANSLLGYDYVYWNAGATWFLHRYAAIDLRYYDERQLNEAAEGSEPRGIDLPAIEDHLVLSFYLGF